MKRAIHVWTRAEEKLMRENYHRGLHFVRRLMPHRTRNSIRKKAGLLGLSRENAPVETPDWPTPAMNLVEQLACLRFRKWHYPVNPAQLRPSLGVV